MKKAFLLVLILFVSVISTACINNLAVQELNNKAKVYLEKGDYENAISRLKSSIDLDGTFFETHYNLGIAYTQAEKFPEAIETFKNAIKLKPNFADTYYSLAVAQENYAQAVIDGTIKLGAGYKMDADTKSKTNEDELKKPKTLTVEEKALVVQILKESVNSYSAYLEKNPDAQDKSDVTEKIEYLKTQIIKYLPNSTTTAGQ